MSGLEWIADTEQFASWLPACSESALRGGEGEGMRAQSFARFARWGNE